MKYTQNIMKSEIATLVYNFFLKRRERSPSGRSFKEESLLITWGTSNKIVLLTRDSKRQLRNEKGKGFPNI